MPCRKNEEWYIWISTELYTKRKTALGTPRTTMEEPNSLVGGQNIPRALILTLPLMDDLPHRYVRFWKTYYCCINIVYAEILQQNFRNLHCCHVCNFLLINSISYMIWTSVFALPLSKSHVHSYNDLLVTVIKYFVILYYATENYRNKGYICFKDLCAYHT